MDNLNNLFDQVSKCKSTIELLKLQPNFNSVGFVITKKDNYLELSNDTDSLIIPFNQMILKTRQNLFEFITVHANQTKIDQTRPDILAQNYDNEMDETDPTMNKILDDLER